MSAPSTKPDDDPGFPFRVALTVSTLGACSFVATGSFLNCLPGRDLLDDQWLVMLGCVLAANGLVMGLARAINRELMFYMVAGPWIGFFAVVPPIVFVPILVAQLLGVELLLVIGVEAAIIAACNGVRVLASGAVYMLCFLSLYYGMLSFTGLPLTSAAANALAERGRAAYKDGDFDTAITCYSGFLKYHAHDADIYLARGAAWFGAGQTKSALRDCDKAIELRPDNADYFQFRGQLHQQGGSDRLALHDYKKAFDLGIDSAKAHNDIAWLLATSPDVAIRNSRDAITHATKACRDTGWANDASLDTLAAAYASADQFDSAIHYQNVAIRTVTSSTVKEQYESRLRLYQAGKRYVEPAKGYKSVDVPISP